MYRINSTTDIPSSAYLLKEVQQMMADGIKIANLNDTYQTLIDEEEAYRKDIKYKLGIDNPNSAVQIKRYMDGLNDSTVVSICCPNGKWTSDKSALTQLAFLGYEFASTILKYRKAKKYADTIKAISTSKDRFGKIHPTVTMTKTNRVSYSDPPLMTIPKDVLWDCIVPSKAGNVLISADIKNQEPNIMINMHNIKSLKPALSSELGLYEYIFSQIPITGRLNLIITNNEKPGIMDNDEMRERSDIPAIYYTPKICPMEDAKVNGENIKLIDIINLVTPVGVEPEFPKEIRVMTANGNVYNLPIEFHVDWSKAANKKKLNTQCILEVDGVISGISKPCEGETRKEFKRAWNAMTYGASALGVKNMCNKIDAQMVYRFFTSIPELDEYRKECGRLARNRVQTVKTYFGTDVTANQPNVSVLKRVLMDLPIQGTAADILSLLVKHFKSETEKMGIADKLKIVFTRHDELIIEASKELIDDWGIDKILAYVRELTEHQVDDWEPFKIDISIVQSGITTDTINEAIASLFDDI